MDSFGPYRTLDRLGEGAFGRVFLAQNTRSPGRLVALKVSLADNSTLEAVKKEGDLMRRLRHPHIVACEDVGYDEGIGAAWLALELLDGGSLRTILEGRKVTGLPCPEGFVRRVLGEVGGALLYIHSEGMLHRDVKPANILLTLTAPPVLKLADFGISKLLESSVARSLVGTQHYFSPELASGQPYGPASDAWALGVVLYELTTLQRPFQGSSMLEILTVICNQKPAELPEDTAPELSKAINGLLEKDVCRRMALQDAVALGSQETANFLAGPPDSACEECSLSTQGLEDLGLPLGSQPPAPAVAFESQPEPPKEKKERSRGWFSWWPFSKADDRRETQVNAIAPAGGNAPSALVNEPLHAEDVEIWELQSLPGQALSPSRHQQHEPSLMP